MKFCEYQDTFTVSRKAHGLIGIKYDPDGFYESVADLRVGSRCNWDVVLDQITERMWWRSKRPYYNVWPAMVDMLLEFPAEKIPISAILDAPESFITAQFPAGGSTRSVLIGVFKNAHENKLIPKDILGSGRGHVLIAIAESSELVPCKDGFGNVMPTLPHEYPTQTSALTIPEGSEDCPLGDFMMGGNMAAFLPQQRLAMAILAMERDPEIFTPDILRADEQRYALASPERRKELEERAFARRGQRGYHVGRAMESIPHFRRPHPAIVWTGKGREVAKIVMRKGSVVHRQKMTKAPTGYLGAEVS